MRGRIHGRRAELRSRPPTRTVADLSPFQFLAIPCCRRCTKAFSRFLWPLDTPGFSPDRALPGVKYIGKVSKAWLFRREPGLAMERLLSVEAPLI